MSDDNRFTNHFRTSLGMNGLVFTKVLSFSSEDTGYESTNLLKPTVAAGKWRCKSGDKSAIVVLQLEKASKIGQIDIGNNGSAFIEVLVGKSSRNMDDFSVILPSSSFMSPGECKSLSGGNTCRVRMFTHDKLVKSVAEESWDMIKIVCTQPFSKSQPYGVSFIKLYPPTNEIKTSVDPELEKKVVAPSIGSTKPVQSSPSVKNIVESSEKHPSSKETKALPKTSKFEPSSKIKDSTGSSRLHQESVGTKSSSDSVSTKKTKPEMANENSAKRSSPPEFDVPRKRVKTESSKPFSGVVFVLSGFQNPERSNLRSKAISLGARYEADWIDRKCTHLICAFMNTPKYNQVKGKGKIVSKRWIEDCYDDQCLLDWEDYELGKPVPSRKPKEKPSPLKTPRDTGNMSPSNLVKHLPDIFEQKAFYLDSSLEPEELRKVKQLIVAFGGSVKDKLSSAVDIAIVDESADISDLQNDHPGVSFVKSDWIHACQRKKQLIPLGQFAV